MDRHAKVCSNLKECSPSIASALLTLSRPLVMHHLASVIKYRGHRRTYADPSLTLWLLVPYEWGLIMRCTAENWVTSSPMPSESFAARYGLIGSGYSDRISISLSR